MNVAPLAWGRRQPRLRAQGESCCAQEEENDDTSKTSAIRTCAECAFNSFGRGCFNQPANNEPEAADLDRRCTAKGVTTYRTGSPASRWAGPMKEAERVALYNRVSTVDQDAAIAAHELRNAARARDLEVALEIQETGSGARNDRPGLQRVLDAARRGEVDAVIVWKLDRFGRSALDLLANIKQLSDEGVRFVSAARAPSGLGEVTAAV